VPSRGQQFISNSAAWAHVELTMLLKNVRLLLVGWYLAFDKIFLEYEMSGMECVSLVAWAHMELSMLLKQVRTPQ